MRRRCCCSQNCAASFTRTQTSANSWRFTDTSPGSHTRSWTTSRGGSGTGATFDVTVPANVQVLVTLTVTQPNGAVCSAFDTVGDFRFCSSCVPANLGATAFVTIPGVGPGPNPACQAIRDSIPGTYAADGSGGCAWGPSLYNKGQCIACSNGFVSNHVVGVSASLIEEGFPAVTNIRLTARVSCGPSTISTDCGTVIDGHSATYSRNLGPPPVNCAGSWSLTKASETGLANLGRYVTWPGSITLTIAANP